MKLADRLKRMLPHPLRELLHRLRPSIIVHRYGLRDRVRVSLIVHERASGVVQRGPFRGMRVDAVLPDSSAKVLGSYEEELHEVLDQLLAERPEQVVNIGCSDGYYAVGCKLRVPDATVWAFDASEQMRVLAAATASLNSSTVEIGGVLGTTELEAIVQRGETLVICDCEGCEYELLDPSRVPSLAHATILVELHDSSGEPAELMSRFRGSHGISTVESTDRDPHEYQELDGLSEHDRSLAVFERPTRLIWAVLVPSR